MAKIDFTTIENWDTMTPEEKLQAIEDYDIPEPDYSGYVKKETFDKTASDLAKLKKDLKAANDSGKKTNSEWEQKVSDMEQKYETLLRESTISKTKARYLALGYTEELAESTATAVVDGDMDTVFENAQKHQKSFEKQIRADALKDTPKPTDAGKGTETMTLEKLRAMTPQDRYTFSVEHPQEYKELYGGKSE